LCCHRQSGLFYNTTMPCKFARIRLRNPQQARGLSQKICATDLLGSAA
jgi:hypothetical protein